ncbi:hypothetical protein WMY93_012708 [Mugilogobius chulae]|uniref:Uncharacterized protein n=1 Tax=Mugilogobius chulae TaxID=88201 RepID=A0AAW0P703_9GOBI
MQEIFQSQSNVEPEPQEEANAREDREDAESVLDWQDRIHVPSVQYIVDDMHQDFQLCAGLAHLVSLVFAAYFSAGYIYTRLITQRTLQFEPGFVWKSKCSRQGCGLGIKYLVCTLFALGSFVSHCTTTLQVLLSSCFSPLGHFENAAYTPCYAKSGRHALQPGLACARRLRPTSHFLAHRPTDHRPTWEIPGIPVRQSALASEHPLHATCTCMH